MEKDLQHLRWLSYGFYIMSGLFGLFAVFSLVFLVFGILFLTTDILQAAGNPPEAAYFLGTANILVALIFIVGGLGLAEATRRTGKNLAGLKNYKFCMIMAIVLCLFSPLGIILGILTIIVLMRDSVKDLFAE